MTGFAADWLQLREPLDAAARTAGNIGVRPCAAPRRGSLNVVDLGSGTGANLRFLAPRLGGLQDWLLVDDDGELLEAAVAVSADWARARGAHWERTGEAFRIRDAVFDCRVRRRQADLAGGLDTLPLTDGSLVSAAALLDLVGEAWLDALARQCRAAAAHVLFALTYDGRIAMTPPDPDDEWIRTLVNRDQRRDKGFGPALGPVAADAAADCFAAAGYDVRRARSDWRIGAAQRHEQYAVLAQWHAAACSAVAGSNPTANASAEADTARVHAWQRRRAALIERAESRLCVGHVDLLGTPPA